MIPYHHSNLPAIFLNSHSFELGTVTFSSYVLRLIPKIAYKYVIFNSSQSILYIFNNFVYNAFFFLCKHFNTRLNYIVDINASDYPDKPRRFLVSYQFSSSLFQYNLRIKTWVGELEFLSSLTSIYSGANWYEREIWDLFGVHFKGHADLRRILTDYGFEGYPLRKDFPLSGYYELRYHENQKRIVYQGIKLTQEFRYFDLLSPWEQIKGFKLSELYAPYSPKNKPLHITDLLPQSFIK